MEEMKIIVSHCTFGRHGDFGLFSTKSFFLHTLNAMMYIVILFQLDRHRLQTGALMNVAVQFVFGYILFVLIITQPALTACVCAVFSCTCFMIEQSVLSFDSFISTLDFIITFGLRWLLHSQSEF